MTKFKGQHVATSIHFVKITFNIQEYFYSHHCKLFVAHSQKQNRNATTVVRETLLIHPTR